MQPEPPYEGAAGATQVERAQVRDERGSLRVITLYTGVDAARDPHLKAQALRGELHRLEDGSQLAVPFVYHDPLAHLFVLVVPPGLRHRELELRAELMLKVARDTAHAVPAYVRDCMTVIGAQALRVLVERPTARGEGSSQDLSTPGDDEDTRVVRMPVEPTVPPMGEASPSDTGPSEAGLSVAELSAGLLDDALLDAGLLDAGLLDDERLEPAVMEADAPASAPADAPRHSEPPPFPTPLAPEALLAGLPNMDEEARVQAAAALVRAGEAAGDALIEGLRAKAPAVRQVCALVLGRLQLRRALVPLIQRVAVEEGPLLEETARALGGFGSGAVRALARATGEWERTDEAPLRSYALALTHLVVQGCAEQVANLEKDANPGVAGAARQARILAESLATDHRRLLDADQPLVSDPVRRLTQRFWRVHLRENRAMTGGGSALLVP